MGDKNHDRFVDELLEAALARYSRVEPRAGLEGRILEQVRTEAGAPRFPWLPVALAVTAAAVALTAAGLYVARRPAPPASPPGVAATRPAPAIPAAPPAPSRLRAEAPAASVPAAGGTRRSPLPRQDTFPAPASLSEQELLLLRYAQQGPSEQLLAASLGQGKLKELRIEPLRIPPLTLEPN